MSIFPRKNEKQTIFYLEKLYPSFDSFAVANFIQSPTKLLSVGTGYDFVTNISVIYIILKLIDKYWLEINMWMFHVTIE